ALPISLRHPTRYHESRKRSVPVRVHSVSKELWFAPTSASGASNLPLTHETVESPSKLCSPSLFWRSAVASNQSQGLCTNPFHWLTTALPYSFLRLNGQFWNDSS